MIKIVTYEYLFDPNNTTDINVNYELECELSQKQIDYSTLSNLNIPVSLSNSYLFFPPLEISITPIKLSFEILSSAMSCHIFI